LKADKEAAEEYFRNASAYLDRMASKNVIHKNKAANAKSRMRRYVNSLS
jgi:small subunit ribosomal protein S20